ncbi:hypothetical protein D3C87_1307530 [compost metagenome]
MRQAVLEIMRGGFEIEAYALFCIGQRERARAYAMVLFVGRTLGDDLQEGVGEERRQRRVR